MKSAKFQAPSTREAPSCKLQTEFQNGRRGGHGADLQSPCKKSRVVRETLVKGGRSPSPLIPLPLGAGNRRESRTVCVTSIHPPPTDCSSGGKLFSLSQRERVGVRENARIALRHSLPSRFLPCNPPGIRSSGGVWVWWRSAECNSAIQQIANLRYAAAWSRLVFEIWNFSGCWRLELGGFL